MSSNESLAVTLELDIPRLLRPTTRLSERASLRRFYGQSGRTK